jgi:hypothetical protein
MIVASPTRPATSGIHPADLRRFFTRNPVEYGRKRQKPSRGILRALRKPADLAGRIVRPN